MLLLRRLADDAHLGDRRFAARNFLLERRVPGGRRQRYESFVATAMDASSWSSQHLRYLDEHIRRVRRPRAGPRAVVPPEDAADTFTVDPLLSSFGDASPHLDLVRAVPVRTLARLADVSPDEFLLATGDALAFQALLDDASDRLDARPVFAGFWEDIADEIGAVEEETVPDWPDRLRDRFGLFHLQPTAGKGIPIVLLRYPVADVPRVRGLRSRKPLAIPTVIDAELFEAFCPAPPGAAVGQLVNLNPSADQQPAGEIVHPPMRFDAQHVFRVGTVTIESPPLSEGRAFHLLWLQALAAPGFGDDTDKDILS